MTNQHIPATVLCDPYKIQTGITAASSHELRWNPDLIHGIYFGAPLLVKLINNKRYEGGPVIEKRGDFSSFKKSDYLVLGRYLLQARGLFSKRLGTHFTPLISQIFM